MFTNVWKYIFRKVKKYLRRFNNTFFNIKLYEYYTSKNTQRYKWCIVYFQMIINIMGPFKYVKQELIGIVCTVEYVVYLTDVEYENKIKYESL